MSTPTTPSPFALDLAAQIQHTHPSIDAIGAYRLAASLERNRRAWRDHTGRLCLDASAAAALPGLVPPSPVSHEGASEAAKIASAMLREAQLAARGFGETAFVVPSPESFDPATPSTTTASPSTNPEASRVAASMLREAALRATWGDS